MKVILDHKSAEAENIETFYFLPEKPLAYSAGQYIHLTLAHDNPDNRGTKRWFTLSSPPGHELVTITTKFASENGSSFKQALRQLKSGAELDMSAPFGDFVLPKDPTIPLVFVAGGIGITPFHSIFAHLAELDEKRSIKFMYGVRSEDEIIFQSTLSNAGVHSTIVVSQPSPAWGGERGSLSAEMIVGIEKPTPETLIYLSGPEAMVEALEQNLHQAGIAKQQIVTDTFPGYSGI